jgi:molybdopterin synthase catalytic subunit
MDAQIQVVVTTSPIAIEQQPTRTDCGTVLDFQGVVRADENGEQIAGLFYEAYQPMAEREIGRIARELISEFPCRFVSVTHRIGFVPAGEASIAVRVAAPHRQEAISFVAEFMNRLKKDVPIWKRTSQ